MLIFQLNDLKKLTIWLPNYKKISTVSSKLVGDLDWTILPKFKRPSQQQMWLKYCF